MDLEFLFSGIAILVSAGTASALFEHMKSLYPWDHSLRQLLSSDRVLNAKYRVFLHCRRSGHRERTREALLDCLQQAPWSAGLTFLLCHHELSENPGRAEELARHCVELDPKHWDALNLLAQRSNERGEVEEACQYSTRAFELAPKDANVAVTHGWILLRRGQYADSLGLLSKWLKPDGRYRRMWNRLSRATATPDNQRALRLTRGVALFSQGRALTARPDILAGGDLLEKDQFLQSCLFWCHLAAEDYAPAASLIPHFEAAYRLNFQGDVDYARGSFFSARDNYSECLKVGGPESQAALTGLAWSNWKLSDLDGVRACLEKEIDLPIAVSSLHLLRAQMALDGQDLSAAQEWLEQAGQLKPADITHLQLLGLIHEAAGRPTEARRAYQDCLALEPGWAPERQRQDQARARLKAL